MELETALKSYGLSDKESKIYLCTLRLGTTTVNRIAELTGIAKTTCYDVLTSLARKGLMSSSIREKVKYFSAADPRQLLAAIENKQRTIKEVLPKLNALKASIAGKPQVELYSGKEGLKAVYDEVLKTEAEFLVFGNHQLFADFFKWFAEQFIAQRVKKRIYCRYISERSKLAESVKRRDRAEYRETRMSALMNNADAECYIFGDKIALITLSKKEPVGVLIENKEIADFQRKLFETMWRTLGK